MLGVVRSLDRANKLARCQITSHGLASIPCRYYGEPPPPLSMVRLNPVTTDTFEIAGVLGDVEAVLDEHFLHTDLIANARGYGDTTWIQSGTLGSIGQGIPAYPVSEQVATHRAQGGGVSSATSHVTTAFSWDAGDLLLVSFATSGATATTVELADGTEFVLQDQVGGLQLWYAVAPAGGTGSVTITLPGASTCIYMVDKITNADRIAPIVQSDTNSNAASTNLVIALAAFAHPGNATYRVTWLAAGKAVTAGAGMTELAEGSGTPDMHSEWAAGPVLSTDQSWVGNTVCAGIAVEVRAATVDPFPTSVGVAQLRTNVAGDPLRLRKSTGALHLGAGDALWLSARVALGGTVTAAFVGIADVVNVDDLARIEATIGSFEWRLRCLSNGNSSFVQDVDVLVANQWYDLDLVIVGGEWAAAWVGDTGPGVVDTNVPGGPSAAMEPEILVNGVSTSTLWVDWLKVRTVNAAGNDGPLVNPNTLIESLQAEEQPPEPADA